MWGLPQLWWVERRGTPGQVAEDVDFSEWSGGTPGAMFTVKHWVFTFRCFRIRACLSGSGTFKPKAELQFCSVQLNLLHRADKDMPATGWFVSLFIWAAVLFQEAASHWHGQGRLSEKNEVQLLSSAPFAEWCRVQRAALQSHAAQRGAGYHHDSREDVGDSDASCAAMCTSGPEEASSQQLIRLWAASLRFVFGFKRCWVKHADELSEL